MLLTDPGTSDVNIVWQQSYQTINACNVFLDGMDASGKKVVSDSLYKNYTAEAKLLRAVTYYSLLQLYARPIERKQEIIQDCLLDSKEIPDWQIIIWPEVPLTLSTNKY